MKIRDRNVLWNVNKPPEPAQLPPSSSLQEGDEWRCPQCKGDLFGIFHEGKLHIKYRERTMIAQGIVTTTCRKCGAATRISTAQVPVVIDTLTLAEIFQPEDEEAEEDNLSQTDINATRQAIDYAREHNINLSSVKGTGKDGRITLKDLIT